MPISSLLLCGCFYLEQMRKKDWVGLKYGKLTIVGETQDGFAIVECECGTKEKLVNKNDLHRSGVKSCGCSRITVEDGNIYGNFRIIKDYFGRDKHKRKTCLAECICGKTIEYSTLDIRNGSLKSCGCIVKLVDNSGLEINGVKIIEDNIDYDKRVKKCKILCHCGVESITLTPHVLSGKTKSCGCIRKSKSHRLIEDSFETVTPESLYWAGFIAADGCVSKNNLTIALKTSDVGHLEKFSNWMMSDAKIGYNSKTNSNKMCISSKTIVKDLINYGITERKSFTYSPPEFCRDSPDFWRGMIDGDGSIFIRDVGKTKNYPGIGLCGTKETCEYFRSYCLQICSFKANVNKHSSIFNIYIGGVAAIKIASQIYGDNPSFFLQRKFDVFNKMLNFA